MRAAHWRVLACLLVMLCAIVPVFSATALDPLAPGAATIHDGDAYVYDSPSDDASVIVVLGDQTEVEIIEGGGEWALVAYYHPVSYARNTGWVRAQSLINLRTHMTPGPNYINLHEGADVLQSASANGVLIGRIQRGTRLDVVSSTSEWVEIVYPQANGQLGTGWVKRPYIVPYTPPATTQTPQVASNNTADDLTFAMGQQPLTLFATPEPTAAPSAGFDNFYPSGTTTVTLNAQNAEHAVKLRKRANAYSTSLGQYHSGVVAEYLSYDPSGWVKVRIGTAEGYWPVEDIWVNAPPGSVPSAIPTGRVVELKSGSSLNLREYPDVNAYSIARFTSGTEVEILAYADSWLHVRVNGEVIGYMYSQYVGRVVTQYVDQNTIPKNPVFTGVVEEPGQDADLEITRADATQQNSWTPVPTPNILFQSEQPQQTAAPEDSVALTNPSLVIFDTLPAARELPQYAIIHNTSGGRLNLRERPDASSRSLGLYNNGVCVTINASYDDEWVNVSVGLTSGYMALNYLDTVNVPKGAPKVYPNEIPRARLVRSGSGSISMYAAMNALSDELGAFSPGTQAIVLGTSQTWSHVVISGRMGYVRNENLSYDH